jgi:predicted dehydrogenase
MAAPIRVLFCGLGGIGQRHLRNLRTLLGDRLDVHAFRVRRETFRLQDDLTIATGANLEVDYGITVHTELDAALAQRPALVMVCNPSGLHTATALAAARAGAHVFIEKPVAASLEGLDTLADELRAHARIGYVGYNFRFHPGLQRLKQLITSGFFGHILGAHAEIGEYLPNWHKYEDYRQMYAARRDQGGGVILSQIHEMDLIYWFFGLPASILCRGGKLSALEIDVEDTASSLMQVDGPAGRFPVMLHQDFVQRPPVRTFKVFGDAGSARIDLLRNVLEVQDREGTLQAREDYPEFRRNDMFLEQSRHLLACIRDEAEPQVDLHAGIQSLRLALAAHASLASGVEVRLEAAA